MLDYLCYLSLILSIYSYTVCMRERKKRGIEREERGREGDTGRECEWFIYLRLVPNSLCRQGWPKSPVPPPSLPCVSFTGMRLLHLSSYPLFLTPSKIDCRKFWQVKPQKLICSESEPKSTNWSLKIHPITRGLLWILLVWKSDKKANTVSRTWSWGQSRDICTHVPVLTVWPSQQPTSLMRCLPTQSKVKVQS